MELAYGGLSDSCPVGADDVDPFWNGEDYFEAFAACAAGDAVPGVDVFPGNGFHLLFILPEVTFYFLVDLFYKRILWFWFCGCCGWYLK